MEVGRYMFSTLPKTLPAGLEKSRCVGRSGLGCVGTGAGAVGRFDEALSGALAPAPDCVAGVASCCCARLSGEPDASASMAAATARRRMPAFPRPLSPLKLALDWRLDCICFGSNTPVAYDCMIPLHEGLKHLRKDEIPCCPAHLHRTPRDGTVSSGVEIQSPIEELRRAQSPAGRNLPENAIRHVGCRYSRRPEHDSGRNLLDWEAGFFPVPIQHSANGLSWNTRADDRSFPAPLYPESPAVETRGLGRKLSISYRLRRKRANGGSVRRVQLQKVRRAGQSI